MSIYEQHTRVCTHAHAHAHMYNNSTKYLLINLSMFYTVNTKINWKINEFFQILLHTNNQSI